MTVVKTYTHSYAGGEITPELLGRLDLAKRQTGLAKCQNFIILPHGPATRRAGTGFVRAAKTAADYTHLLPFAFSAEDTMVLEFGNGYLRFHTQGATLVYGTPAAYNGATAYTPGDLVESGGSNYVCIADTTGNAPPNATYWYVQPADGAYEIPTSYATADLPYLSIKQSADVLTIMHPTYPTRELRRAGALKWYTSAVSFAPGLSAPTGVTATATVGTGTVTYDYVVTSVADDGVDESLASSNATCTNNLLTAGNFNTVTWSAATGASRYNVYKKTGGVYAYIGQASGLTFKDDNFAGDQAKTPPENLMVLNNATGNYPATGTYHEQRRWFAGTDNDPQVLKATRSATDTNLTSSIPGVADDAIDIRLVAQKQNRIRHLVPLGDLIALTAGGYWLVYSPNSDVLSANTVTPKLQGGAGASKAPPVLTSNSVLYVQARGSQVRELTYTDKTAGNFLNSVNMSLMAPHLFNSYTITQMAYSEYPEQICWGVRSDGVLLGMTYIPEHQVYAWHQHVTDGFFESICVVAEGGEDFLYAVVRRTVNGSTVRYVERMRSRLFTLLEDAFFVDSGLTYTGTAADVISGLGHLEGEEVAVLANGAAHPRCTVTGGQITLQAEYTKVHIGLPIVADAQTLPLALEGAQASGQGTVKNVNEVFLRITASSPNVQAGPSFDRLTSYPGRAVSDPYGSPPALQTREIEMTVEGDWNQDASICIRKDDALPLTLLSTTLKVAIGG